MPGSRKPIAHAIDVGCIDGMRHTRTGSGVKMAWGWRCLETRQARVRGPSAQWRRWTERYPAARASIFHRGLMIGVQGGAGEGNRTLVISLEGFCSTIELHPQINDLACALCVFALASRLDRRSVGPWHSHRLEVNALRFDRPAPVAGIALPDSAFRSDSPY